MIFKKIETKSEAVAFLLREIDRLSKMYNSLTWLVPGGSNIKITAEVFQALSTDQLKKITILLTDERYGPVGHPDSNYQQLIEAGVDFNKTKSYPVLCGLSIEDTANQFALNIKEVFGNSDFIFGQFGIGADGHTCGILPNTTASVDEENAVVAYSAGQYDRISISFKTIRMINEICMFAYGDDKLTALHELQTEDVPLDRQPAQILKDIKEVYIINDRIGE